MENAIETIERDGFTAYIYYDTDTLNPRKDWDNFGKIVSRKLTSDEHFEFSGDSETDIKRLKQEFGATVILPFTWIRMEEIRLIRLVSRVLGIADK